MLLATGRVLRVQVGVPPRNGAADVSAGEGAAGGAPVLEASGAATAGPHVYAWLQHAGASLSALPSSSPDGFKNLKSLERKKLVSALVPGDGNKKLRPDGEIKPIALIRAGGV